MRLVRDVDVVLDPERGRVGEYDREAVVRLFREYEFRTLIDRLPPLVGERPEDAVGAMRELRDAGFPAAQGRGGGRAAAPGGGSGRGHAPVDDGSLQLSMDFDVVSGGGSGAPAHAIAETSPAVEARAEALARHRATCRGRWPRRSWIPVGSRSPTRRASRPWSRGCGSRTPWASPSWSTTRGRSRGPRWPSPWPGRTGGSWRPRDPRRPIALRHLLERLGTPLVGHDVKPLLTARFAEDPDATPHAGGLRHPGRRLPRQRRPARPEDRGRGRGARWTSSCRRPPPACRRRAVGRPRGAVGPRRPSLAGAVAPRRGRGPPVRRDRAAADPDPRPDGGGRRSRSTRTRCRPSSASSRPRSTRLEAEIFAVVGHQFTIGSPKQLGELLFVELGLPKGRKTKTGYSTDATVLEELRGVHPVVELVLDWRTYTKLRSTYVEALPNLIGPDGRLHTLFHQAVAATGRLSSSDPNLQNIPIRTPLGRRIRHAFVAGLAGHDAGRGGLQPDRAADPRPRVGRRAPRATRSRARPTSTARRPPACCARRPRTSPATSGRWPRWSTSGWPTG